MQEVLKVAPMVTIFGYGAPASDVEAIQIMKEGWGDSQDRKMEQIEIINTLSDEELYRTWSPFIHNSHYQHTKEFFGSWIIKHPRRSIEAYFEQHWQARFTQTNEPPRNVSLIKLREWFGRIAEKEVESE